MSKMPNHPARHGTIVAGLSDAVLHLDKQLAWNLDRILTNLPAPGVGGGVFVVHHNGYVRYFSVILSGMLAAAGGAYLTVGYLGTYNENVTAGRGFIALAALIFGNWRPFGAFGAALLFGLSTAIAFRLPVYSATAATLFQALPYVITLIAVAGVIGRSTPPAAVGRPYVKQ